MTSNKSKLIRLIIGRFSK